MNPFVTAKLVLVLAGIGAFLLSSGREDQLLRRVAIGLVAAAFALRFVERVVRSHQRRRDQEHSIDQEPSI